jgi:DNA-binding response OmpR family regulator
MAKIYIIEDDEELSDTVKDCLVCERHVVEQAFAGKEGLDHLRFYQYDLIILDWDLPEITGLQVCTQFRARGGKTPILFLTGMRDISFKEAGFDAGCDDYLTKPFEMRELSVRVKALLRRPPPIGSGNVLQAKHVILDPTSSKVTADGVEVKLNPKEYALLEFLMRHPNTLFSPEALLDRVWNTSSDSTTEAITTVVSRLRKKLDVEGKPSIIDTVRNMGYRLDD